MPVSSSVSVLPERLFVKRTEVRAGAVICAFQIHSERIPGGRTENSVFIHVVHTDRYPEHGRQRDEVGSDMSVVERAVVCAPVCHHGIDILECAFAGEVRHEISGRLSGIGAAVNDLMRLVRQLTGVTFGDLKDRTQTVNAVDTRQSNGHSAFGVEVGGIAAAAEITEVGGNPFRLSRGELWKNSRFSEFSDFRQSRQRGINPSLIQKKSLFFCFPS